MSKRRRNLAIHTHYRTPNFFRRMQKYLANKRKLIKHSLKRPGLS